MKAFPFAPLQMEQMSAFPGDAFFCEEVLLFNSKLSGGAQRRLSKTSRSDRHRGTEPSDRSNGDRSARFQRSFSAEAFVVLPSAARLKGLEVVLSHRRNKVSDVLHLIPMSERRGQRGFHTLCCDASSKLSLKLSEAIKPAACLHIISYPQTSTFTRLQLAAEI